MKYGYFNEEKKEYVITRPDTPTPWINYLFGKNISAFISQSAGGCAWYGEADTGRLTRYRFNGMPVDTPGFYLYIQDGTTTWNPSFSPLLTKLDDYTCSHGLGYTRFNSEKNNLGASVNYFIPHDQDIFIWDMTLTNNSDKPKEIRLLTYLEFSLHVLGKDTDAYFVCGNQWKTTFEKELNSAHIDYFAFESPFKSHALFTSSEKVTGYELDREKFTGFGRTESNPIILSEKLRNSQLPDGGGYPCGALENKIILKPGEKKRIIYKYAISEKLPDTKKNIAKFADFKTVDNAFSSLNKYWKNKLAVSQIKTPDSNINNFINTWLPYNIHVTSKVSRSISSRHVGTGGAIRFRDTMQDLMLGGLFSPTKTRKRILLVYQTMQNSGRTLFGVNPKTMIGDEESITRIDAALWGVFAIYKYLAETDDVSILEEFVPYYDKGNGTIMEHIIKGMEFIGNNLGKNGLPKLFDVDWNDMLQIFSADNKNDGETVMVAEQYIYATKLLKEIFEYANIIDNNFINPTSGFNCTPHGRASSIPPVLIARFLIYIDEKSAKFAEIINSDVCWDGSWFKRLLFKNFDMGSSNCEEGQIFLNTQSWGVISGKLNKEKIKTAMNSVSKKLDTKYGIKTFTPPFTKKPDKTFFDANPPGAGENGGLFLHANTWAIMAESILQNKKRAWQYFSQILPPNRADDNPDIYAGEPYVFTSWIYAPEHHFGGKAQLTWLTGGASWYYIAATEYLLGIKPTLHGLEINPLFPDNWKTFDVIRKIRKTIYNISIKKVDTQSKTKILIDGKIFKGKIIPYSNKKSVKIELYI